MGIEELLKLASRILPIIEAGWLRTTPLFDRESPQAKGLSRRLTSCDREVSEVIDGQRSAKISSIVARAASAICGLVDA